MIDHALILHNAPLNQDVWKMVLKTDLAKEANCGQFVMAQVDGFFLRRPISISNVTEDTLTLVYKILGKGTEVMTHLKPGQIMNLEGPLGTGFPVLENRKVLLLGGGVGVPPLLLTAKKLLEKGCDVRVALGFNTKTDLFYSDEFEQLGLMPKIATMDGSIGIKGTVLDVLDPSDFEDVFVMACGPLPMLKAVQNTFKEGCISLEARMACGIGACMGCVVLDHEGNSLRVCKNGPVFEAGKVVL